MPAHGRAILTKMGCAPPRPTQAQSVNLFSLIDLGTECVGNVSSPAHHSVRVPSLTGTVSSRLGPGGHQ